MGIKLKKLKNKKVHFFLVMTVLLLTVLFSVLFFTYTRRRYWNSVVKESTYHLREINTLINSYIEQSFDKNRSILNSFAISLETSDFTTKQEAISMFQEEGAIWDSKDIRVYTSEGQGFHMDGSSIKADEAAETALRVTKNGPCVDITGAKVTFFCPIRKKVILDGQKIVAISISYYIDTMIDDIHISSFDNQAEVFLCTEDGVVLSRYRHNEEHTPYNLKQILKSNWLFYIDGGIVSYQEALMTEVDTAFFSSAEDEDRDYVIISPVCIEGAKWILVYIVPENSVNKSMNSFSILITGLSVVTSVVFLALCIILFMSFYLRKKRNMDRVFASRERLFRLLSENTANGFALVNRTKNQPLYISSNTRKLLGENEMYVNPATEKLSFVNIEGKITKPIEKINELLLDWDEESEFDSGSILIPFKDRISYVKLKVYPTDTKEEFVVIAYDVTADHEHEETLRSALALAESANKAKSQFLSNMSHDIRTPMNAIVNMTDFALECISEPKKLTNYLQTIKNSSDHLLRLINDVLDMSRIDNGRVEIENQTFSIKECIDGIEKMIKSLADQKKQSFQIHQKMEDETVIGDRLKLTQILVNILSNAVKYTGEGGEVIFTVEEFPEVREGMTSFRFTISDTGVGIAESDVHKIFEPFSRINSSQNEKIQGTGLGLSISKGYITAMGGTIHVQSVPQEGSTFVVEIALKKGNAEGKTVKEVPVAAKDLTGLRVLLVDDDEMNRKIAGIILEKLSVETEFAGNGKEAVAMFLSSEQNYYQAIFMDIQMPGMNGYEATRTIRASGHGDAQKIPIFALSANVFAEDITSSHDAGMNGHLGKPISVQAFRKALNTLR